MKAVPIHKSDAFTLVELFLVIVVVFVLILMLLPVLIHERPQKAERIYCLNNLKQIGTAYRIWANDHGGHYPASESVTNEGWRELLTSSDQGFLCWTNFAIMANEMGQSPRIVVCPSDERQPAVTFSNLFANTNLSYFVGVSANDNQPQSLLGGDRNLGDGTKPAQDYGFSPRSGQGNNVAIQTNSQSGPVCWTIKIHSSRHSGGAGNILLADGRLNRLPVDIFARIISPWPAKPPTGPPATFRPPLPSASSSHDFPGDRNRLGRRAVRPAPPFLLAFHGKHLVISTLQIPSLKIRPVLQKNQARTQEK